MRCKLGRLLRRLVVWVDPDIDELGELTLTDEVEEKMLIEATENAAKKERTSARAYTHQACLHSQ